jgi:hypothetical protein
MERTSKLLLARCLNKRTARATDAFIGKLAYANSKDRYQLTSDGFNSYDHYPPKEKDDPPPPLP